VIRREAKRVINSEQSMAYSTKDN